MPLLKSKPRNHLWLSSFLRILNPLYQQFLSVLPSKYIPNLNYFYHVHHHLLPKPQALPGISIPALVSLQAIFHPASRTTFKCILDNFISQFKTFCSFVLCFNKNQISYLSPQSPALIPLRNFLPLSASSWLHFRRLWPSCHPSHLPDLFPSQLLCPLSGTFLPPSLHSHGTSSKGPSPALPLSFSIPLPGFIFLCSPYLSLTLHIWYIPCLCIDLASPRLDGKLMKARSFSCSLLYPQDFEESLDIIGAQK